MPRDRRPTTMFVGAFPRPGQDVHGGMVTSCRALLGAGLADRLDLVPVDSTTRSVPPPPVAVRLLYAIARMARVVATIERRRPVASIFFTAVGLSFVEKTACAWYAERRGGRALVFMRGGGFIDDCRRSPRYRRFAARLLGRASRVVCQGATWRDFLVHELGLRPERVVVIENWTASDELLALGAARAEGAVAGGGVVRILFVGWIDREKGALDLIEAFARVAARHPAGAVRLTLCGEGTASAEAARLAERLGVSDAVERRGWVAPAGVHAALAESDVFALPSYAEGFPNALVEAMAAGLACVATPVGSIPDVMHDGVNGRLVTAGDVEALASRLDELVASPEARRRLGSAAHRTARDRFSAATAVDRIVEVVRHATGAAAGDDGSGVAASREVDQQQRATVRQ